tara:strand:- start:138 stop:1046 length:909 start_codon:yes stop_codon:yes gene_type:complete
MERENDFFDLKDIFRAIWEEKIIFSTIVAFFAISSVFYALSIPNVYQSKAILAPSDSENQDMLMSRYRGLSSLAGINLPVEEVSKSVEGIERFRSFDFFKTLVDSSFQKQDIIATKGWDPKTNNLYYDPNLYNSVSKEWVREVRFPKTQIPSDQEAFEIFQESFSIFLDDDSGFITLKLNHHSPYIAKNWLDEAISSLNELMRNEDKKRAQKSLDYLNYQISDTNLTEIKQVLSLLIQKQIETLTLIETNEEYVFKIIDSPIIPERKISPSRPVICILITFVGLIIATIYSFYRYTRKLKKY